MGFEDLGAHNFKSQEAHVHWVYVAYILLNKMEAKNNIGVKERQEELWRRWNNQNKIKETNKLIQLGSRIEGKEQLQNFFKKSLEILKSA